MLIKQICQTPANLRPDLDSQTLTVQLHHLTNPLSDRAAAHLAEVLNQSETKYPGTDLRLVFEMVSPVIPGGQEV